MILNPQQSLSFTSWADADFSGKWQAEVAHKDSMTSNFQTGWAITYVGCPIS